VLTVDISFLVPAFTGSLCIVNTADDTCGD